MKLWGKVGRVKAKGDSLGNLAWSVRASRDSEEVPQLQARLSLLKQVYHSLSWLE
ncbi:hypothetical protein M407DRAFT_241993 [Tulasnella calospora MUT 4182]|uniref:Uncharacterized protein n=1 Tax=Tulasnella calospora MUT 4182 TaxID=1051891 RepID=A0A0C3MB15_9AGAM|nr:hypothetical protein M407DRAFT_241993 [Tulasnella calospora MUT 4182]